MTITRLQCFIQRNSDVPAPLKPNGSNLAFGIGFFSRSIATRVKNCAMVLCPHSHWAKKNIEKNKEVTSTFLLAIRSVYGQNEKLESKHRRYFSGQYALTACDTQRIAKSFRDMADKNSSKVRDYLAKHSSIKSSKDKTLQEQVVRKAIEAIGARQVTAEQLKLIVEEKIATCVFKDAGVEENHITPLLEYIQRDNKIPAIEWATRYQHRDQALLSSFNALIKAFNTETSQPDTLERVYKYANDAEFFIQFDPKIPQVDVEAGKFHGANDAMSYQKNLVAAKLETLPKEQVEQLFEAILTHPVTREIIAFMSTPSVNMDLATNCVDDQKLCQCSIQAWAKPSAVIMALVDSCSQHLGDDRKKQSDDFIEHYSTATYAGNLSLIDRSFYADLAPLWKQYFGLDIDQILSLPKSDGGILSAAERRQINDSWEGIRKDYQYLSLLNKGLPEDGLSEGEQIENGLFSIFIKDLLRSSYTINGYKLDRSKSLAENVKHFKELIPDPHQQLLISYFANQCLFADVESIFIKKLNGIPLRAEGKTNVSYQITTQDDGTVHLSASEESQLIKFNAFNQEDEDKYSALAYHIDLSFSHKQQGLLHYRSPYLTLDASDPVRYNFTQRAGLSEIDIAR